MISFLLLVPLASSCFASTVWITIWPGGAFPDHRPNFSPSNVTAYVGDEIAIGNADSDHKLVSSPSETEPDGKINGVLAHGTVFRYTLTSSDVGTLHIYDPDNPWMVEAILVEEAPPGYKVVHNVGADAGDGKTTFDVQYSSVKNITSSSIDVKENRVNFTLAGNADKNSDLVLRLPYGLLGGQLVGVWLDNHPTNNFNETEQGDENFRTLTIPITQSTEQVSVAGSSVVPEFGAVAALVLAIAIMSVIAVSIKMGVRFIP